MNEEEKLINDKRKIIINEIVSVIARDNIDLYYSPTTQICTEILDYLRENKISKEKYELVKDLSAKDIQILISYQSNCCS